MTCEGVGNDGNMRHQATSSLFDNQLLSVDRLSKFLDVPAATIRDWVYKRLIPFVKVGRHIRFTPSDVQRWLSERSHGNGHPHD